MAVAEVGEKDASTDRTEFTVLIREIAASGLAAAVAGLIAGGVGGRLAMRISAMLNPVLRGVRSENGNQVGDITTGGTIELVLFGGLLSGVVAAAAWVIIRPWLPSDGWRRYGAGSVAAVGLAGFAVVQSDNFDFRLLEPAWAHVAMFTGIVGAAGLLAVWFDERLVHRLRWSRRFTPFAFVIVALGVLLVPPSLGSFFMEDFCFCGTPPRPAGTMLLITLVATMTTWISRLRGAAEPSWLSVLGRAASIGAVLAGLIHLAGQVNAIL